MLPLIFKAGPITVYTFGLMLFLAVLTGSYIVWKQARRKGLAEEQILDILLLVLFLGMLGGRWGYVFMNSQIFSPDWSRVFLFARYPGFSFQSALVSGVFVALAFSKLLGFVPLMVLDLLTIAFSWSAIFGFLGRVLERPVSLWAAGVFMLCGSILAALLINQISAKVNSRSELAILSRQYGLYFFAYLIFISFLYMVFDLITKGNNVGVYLGVFIITAVFFIIRYRKALTMIKFPENILTQIRSFLENKRKETEKRMRELKKEDPFEDKTRLLDRASDDSEAQNKARHERIAAMQQQLAMALAQTRKALTKIKIGKYGVCESCGKMIDTDRLAVMPAATLCVSCEKKKEKK